MHDPLTVAFEIYLGPKKKKNGRYRSPFITIWHKDPEKNGDDDSCGWFMREHHCDPEMREKIKKALSFSFDSVYVSDSTGETYFTGYFDPRNGNPVMSVLGIGLCMFNVAAWEFFKYDRKKESRWIQKNLAEILHFIENPHDSLRSEIIGQFREPGKWDRERALEYYTSVIYGYILRSNRKWWRHPRWHIHHWRIQFHLWKRLKRRYWDKCCVCGKRGFKGQAFSSWGSDKIWHAECDKTFGN